jgi:hypothetical protein
VRCLAGGNEWYGKLPATLFEQFVLPTIVAEDMSRAVWPASPSAGLATGVYTLTGLPNGKPFRIVDQDSSACQTSGDISRSPPRKKCPPFSTAHLILFSKLFRNPRHWHSRAEIEVHGPYRHGTGFATVNSLGPFEPFDANQARAVSRVNQIINSSKYAKSSCNLHCSKQIFLVEPH